MVIVPPSVSCLSAYGEDSGEVGVVLQGAAMLTRLDYNSNRTILERLEPGSVFGEVLDVTPSLDDRMEVVSDDGTEVLFMEYDHIMRRCEKACAHHSKLVRNMFQLVVERARQLGQRVEILSRRSIRDKLLCYFTIRAQETGSDTFTMPFTLSALADYISADRRAMMRELKKMREQGLVVMKGRKVTLAHQETWFF